jgi:NCAIR mutase (PurE)-related protein
MPVLPKARRRPRGAPATAGPRAFDGLRALLDAVAAGETPVDEAVRSLRAVPAEELGFATLDHDRALRKGFPEVVFCAGKTPVQAAEIVARLSRAGSRVLATRASAEHFRAARRRVRGLRYDAVARAMWLERLPRRSRLAGVAVVAAGTSDVPVAEEAALTLDLMGHAASRIYDVGVAGLHRLIRHAATLRAAHVLIVVAGMEGALPSVVGGLVAAPVIAVPTSIGYGASFGGLAALLAMLNSCAPGVAVVNIDNGFGAGYLAATINRRIHDSRSTPGDR